jgi:biotin synthase
MKHFNPLILDAYKILDGKELTREEADGLINIPKKDIPDLVSLASKVKGLYSPGLKQICTIINAKSGKCSEDCNFCAQSAHYRVAIETFDLKSADDILEQAKTAEKIGSSRFGIVTSGKGIKDNTPEFNLLTDAIKKIKKKTNIEVCASLGVIECDTAKKLKEAGISMYHHNLETAPSYYNEICTTHSSETRIETVKNIKKAGIQVCSGGIIGLGESREQRIELAFTLKDLNVDSIPINILTPIEGTPSYSRKEELKLPVYEIIKTVAVFRLIHPDKIIKIAAGRESVLKDFMGLAFIGGADGMLQGGYLTVKGRDVLEDKAFAEELSKFY